ncbi:protease Do-like 2, chloroplastic [Actinidia eriantha]|uniref:protease Do-like 2, chloroplastic n=1 Tax=Actinidia eriantha TaxID=165200 RepID=UPI00258A047C|nr:protease Do-like 2, chloroplastic [Actinidia eriantha]
MATAAVACWFPAITPTGTPRHPLACSQRLFATSHSPTRLFVPKAAADRKRRSPKKAPHSSPRKSTAETETIQHKKFPGRSKDKRTCLNADGRHNRGRSLPTALKALGVQGKDTKGFLLDLKDKQVETSNLQDSAFLKAVVKVYCTHTEPDFALPWKKQRPYGSTGSAFMIGDGKLLTNAHVVEHATQVKVKRRGDDIKYTAKVLAIGAECDIALLSVESKQFWKEAEPLQFGCLPRLQDAVTVVGYPLGGDTISVTKGIVSRIEVTSYGSSELLSIQIDAALNPGNSGGPTFNDRGECIGVAFQAYRSEETENIGYVIPTMVVSHFLEDYERNRKYSGFPCLGVLLQKLENPALQACLKVPYNEGVLVRRIEPTSDACKVLKEGDVIVSFDGVKVGCEGTVPFRSTERITFRYLISQKFAGDVAELGIIRAGAFMKVHTVLNPPVYLVPHHIEGSQPSYLIVGGLVFTPLTVPLIVEETEDSLGLKLLAKKRYSLPMFKGEQIVILTQVLPTDVNDGYEDMGYQQVLKFNGTRIKNIHHLTHLVDSCKDKYFVFEFEDSYMAVLEREACAAASFRILKGNGILSERSDDLLEPYVDPMGDNEEDFVETTVSNPEVGFESLIWA